MSYNIINGAILLKIKYYKEQKTKACKGNGGLVMGFPISAALLDSMVLAIVEKEDTYGYEITRNLREVADVSESTLYPVLRRLQKNMLLETYDREYMGRNRRYYRVTAKGITALDDYRAQWQHHKEMIDSILEK